ncbi:MAG TPA: valine--tRNA ligase [archaeon]|nr:valine--tRNA ligase [archaeon]
MPTFPEKYTPSEAEPRIQKFWAEKKIFKFNPTSKKKVFSIDTPPPTMSGPPHMGHILGYSTAEFIARYKRMRGFEVFYPMGSDDNGLASDRYVEKKLGIRSKDFSRQEFVKLCLKTLAEERVNWKKVWEYLGISVDWDLLYNTISPEAQKLSQLAFLDLAKKKLVYKAEGPTVWCPTCQTAIAQAEIEDSQRKTFLSTINFDLVNSNEKIQIATTRPELLPACVGIFIHPSDQRYKKLLGKKAVVPIFGQEVPIMEDEKVDPAFGTGIVMICTFGDKTDVEWWQKYSLPLKIVIDRAGRLTEKAGEFEDLKIEEARGKILAKLETDGKIVEQKQLDHAVNVHERCGTPMEIFVSSQWNVKILEKKSKWLELGEKIKWFPEHMHVRYNQWVEGLNSDWIISRQRFFGIPFPVWYCNNCGEMIFAEEKDLPIDPVAASPKKKCKCGSTSFRADEDVMDTWFTSATSPLINSRWGEKKNLIEKIYPMNLRPQGYDIIRTWAFYTIMRCWTHTGKIPWENIMINGMGLDPHGKAMHKSKGNVVEPGPLKEKYSADALRYWATNARLGEDMPFQEKDLATGQRLVNKIWNASRLASLSLSKKPAQPKKLEIMDRWLLAKLMKTVQAATESFEKFEYSSAKQETEILFWKIFCDNYLETAKARLYANDASAKFTLHKSLLTVLKLFAPIIPHITEEVFQNLFAGFEKEKSIHISAWPEFEKKYLDEKAEKAGDLAVKIISAIRQWKQGNKLALNTELTEVSLKCNAEEKKIIQEVAPDIAATMKIKNLLFSADGKNIVDGTEIKFSVSTEANT